jgi:predicted nucleic acid-binding protein
LFFCGESNSTKDKALSSVQKNAFEQQKIWDSSSELFKKITKSSNGIIRSVNWGQDLQDIKEVVEVSEVQPEQGKSFTQFLDDSDLNFVDITYQTNADQKITQITLDVFLDESKEVGDLFLEFKSYFDLKFGKSQMSDNKYQWLQNKNTQVILEDVSTSKDPGINMIFSKKN